MTTSIHSLLIPNIRIEEEAALAALLSEFFTHNPDAKLVDSLAVLDPDSFGGSDDVRRALEQIRTAAETCRTVEGESAVLDLKRDWTKLFRGVAPGYGPTAPYGILFMKNITSETMADLAALYLDGGYDGFQEIHDRIDYIGTEMQFLSVLNLQRMHALTVKDAAGFDRLTRCRHQFLKIFLLPWLSKYVDEAQKHVKTGFYSAVLALTSAVAVSLSLNENEAKPAA